MPLSRSGHLIRLFILIFLAVSFTVIFFIIIFKDYEEGKKIKCVNDSTYKALAVFMGFAIIVFFWTAAVRFSKYRRFQNIENIPFEKISKSWQTLPGISSMYTPTTNISPSL